MSQLDKRMTPAEIVGQLCDGMTLGIGGWGPRRKPMADSTRFILVNTSHAGNVGAAARVQAADAVATASPARFCRKPPTECFCWRLPRSVLVLNPP